MSYRPSRIRDVFKDPLIVAFRRDNSIWDVVVYENNKKNKTNRSIRESPRNCPFMKINGNEAPKGPSPINFQEWTDTRSFSDLKYT